MLSTNVSTDWRILRNQADFAIAVYRDVFVLVWRHDTTMEGCAAVRHDLFEMAQTRPKGLALITIVEELAPMPPAESRQELAKILTDASDHIRASAVVFEGTGFRAAAVRSVVVGLTMLARQKFPHKVFGNLPDAASWMHATWGDSLENGCSVAQLERAIVDIRAAIVSGRSAS
jgi:hypothetical protein